MRKLNLDERNELLLKLEQRFGKNINRHPKSQWNKVLDNIQNNDKVLYSLFQMEESGGEPDVVEFASSEKILLFVDCSAETPKGRRSICYDHEALESRKQYKPENSAVNMAEEMGIELMTEEEYFEFQKLGKFDTKTSSWLKTPAEIRQLGGALFGDYRFGRVFIYHNGADSYYGVRGFRGVLRLN